MTWLTTIFSIMALTFMSMPAASRNHISTAEADSLLMVASDPDKAGRMLEMLEAEALTGRQRCEIHWRMARVLTVKGEKAADKEKKKEFYHKGLGYASSAIGEDPANPQGYMWHCACTGRECQMKPPLKQAAAVPVMIQDLSYILDTLKEVDMSEAWQALAEIYYHHPFKPTDGAINFMRCAVRTIPHGELRLSSYLFLSNMLYDRNRSAEKRTEAIARSRSDYERCTSCMEKYSFMDVMLGPEHIPAWSEKPIGSISDREEAYDILEYALHLYEKASVHSPGDKEDYDKLTAAAASYKK